MGRQRRAGALGRLARSLVGTHPQAAVEAQAATLRGPQGFVLDLRAASGASAYTSTARGYGLANRIWTPEFTVSRQPVAGMITYRATPGNRQWYADTLGRMEGDPVFAYEYPAVIEETKAILAAMDAAIAGGQASFTLQGRAPVADTGAANPVQGPVIVLVDAGCSGGCLDTLDLVSRLPNVRIVTSAQTTEVLGDGAKVSISTKLSTGGTLLIRSAAFRNSAMRWYVSRESIRMRAVSRLTKSRSTPVGMEMSFSVLSQ